VSEIVTPRLTLRRPHADDLEALFALTNDPEMHRFLGKNAPSRAVSFPRLLQNAGSWSLYGYGSYIVIDRATGAMIGNCGVFRSYRGLGEDFDNMPEAGWIIARDHWGKGLAREAMNAALASFDHIHGRQKIVAMIESGNDASETIAAALGFTFIRTAPLDGATMRLFNRT
jgi:RimJ/RimL family protein N-acetyltransferase